MSTTTAVTTSCANEVAALRHALAVRLESMCLHDADDRHAVLTLLEDLRARLVACTLYAADGDVAAMCARVLFYGDDARAVDADTSAFLSVVFYDHGIMQFEHTLREMESKVLTDGRSVCTDGCSAALCLHLTGGATYGALEDAVRFYRDAHAPRLVPDVISAADLDLSLSVLISRMARQISVASARDGALVLECVHLFATMAPVTPSRCAVDADDGDDAAADDDGAWYAHGKAMRGWLGRGRSHTCVQSYARNFLDTVLRWVVRYWHSPLAPDIFQGRLSELLAHACICASPRQVALDHTLLTRYVQCAALLWPRLKVAAHAYMHSSTACGYVAPGPVTPAEVRASAAQRVLLAAAPVVLGGELSSYRPVLRSLADLGAADGAHSHPLLLLLHDAAYRHRRAVCSARESAKYLSEQSFDVLYPCLLRRDDWRLPQHYERVRSLYMKLSVSRRRGESVQARAARRGAMMREFARRDFRTFSAFASDAYASGNRLGMLKNVAAAQMLLDPRVDDVLRAHAREAVHLCLAAWHVVAPEAVQEVLPSALRRAHAQSHAKATEEATEATEARVVNLVSDDDADDADDDADAMARARRGGKRARVAPKGKPCYLASAAGVPEVMRSILAYVGTHEDLPVMRGTRRALASSRACYRASRLAQCAAARANAAAQRALEAAAQRA